MRKDNLMAKIASSAKVRRRLHALPVAVGLVALLMAVLLTQQNLGF
jgi:translation elongation factor EF-1beta